MRLRRARHMPVPCGIVSSHLEPTGIRVSASNPAGDHAINRKFQRVHHEQRSCQTRCRRSVYRCNEHERGRYVPELRLHPGLIHAELQARFGAIHTFFLAFSSKVFHTFSSHRSETLTTNGIGSALVDFTQRAMHHINRNSRMFAFQRIGNTATSASGSSPSDQIHSVICPTCKTNAVACLALRWCQSWGGHRISFLRV